MKRIGKKNKKEIIKNHITKVEIYRDILLIKVCLRLLKKKQMKILKFLMMRKNKKNEFLYV
jgi:hypothetical protein